MNNHTPQRAASERAAESIVTAEQRPHEGTDALAIAQDHLSPTIRKNRRRRPISPPPPKDGSPATRTGDTAFGPSLKATPEFCASSTRAAHAGGGSPYEKLIAVSRRWSVCAPNRRCRTTMLSPPRFSPPQRGVHRTRIIRKDGSARGGATRDQYRR
jgi:hypothetical protein